MKRILSILLLSLLVLSCGDVSEPYKVPFDGKLKDGKYIWFDGKMTVIICTGVERFSWDNEDGRIKIQDMRAKETIFRQDKGVEQTQIDGHKVWTYSNGLSIMCIPTAKEAFTGKVISNTSDIGLPEQMNFEADY